MQQLTWFPRGHAQPGLAPAEETRQTYRRELAALDLKQASQFAAMQAIGTSLVWRGIFLVLLHTMLQGMRSPPCPPLRPPPTPAGPHAAASCQAG